MDNPNRDCTFGLESGFSRAALIKMEREIADRMERHRSNVARKISDCASRCDEADSPMRMAGKVIGRAMVLVAKGAAFGVGFWAAAQLMG